MHKLITTKTFAIFAALILISIPAFSAGYVNFICVSPHDGNPLDDYADELANGTIRTITGTLPSDFVENNQTNIGYGAFSNRLLIKENNVDQCYLYIWLQSTDPSNNLVSSKGDTIPASNLKLMVAYTNGSGETSSSNYHTYAPFSTIPELDWVYHSSLSEGHSGGGAGDAKEVQLKYAVQVPNNQPPGVYNGTIYYRMKDSDPTRTQTKTCPIEVTVGDYFRLSVDRGSVDFEKMTPGDTKDNAPVEGIILASSTNTGRPWYLKISNNGPLSSGPFIIPNSNFIWYGWTDGTGRWYGNGDDPLSLTPMLMYSSGAMEGNNMPDGTKNHLKFKLSVPKGQPGGRYISNVKLTLTE